MPPAPPSSLCRAVGTLRAVSVVSRTSLSSLKHLSPSRHTPGNQGATRPGPGAGGWESGPAVLFSELSVTCWGALTVALAFSVRLVMGTVTLSWLPGRLRPLLIKHCRAVAQSCYV